MLKRALVVLIVLLLGALLAGASAQSRSRDALGYPGTLLFTTPSGQLGRVNANGTGSAILPDLGRFSDAELSRDGRLLGDLENGRLFVASVSGGGRRLIASDVHSWTWAPDSQRIAYSTFAKQIRQIFVVRSDGSDPRQITRNARATSSKFDPYNELAWSPDGTRIAFLNWQNYSSYQPMNGGRLFTVSSGGGPEVPGPRLGTFRYPGAGSMGWGFVPFTISWSPDGRALAVASEAESGVLVVRGTRVTWLRGSDCCVGPSYLSWSPDGNRVAFLGADTSAGDSGGVAAPNGSIATVLGSGDRTPVWSPDGSWLAFLECGYDSNGNAAPCRLHISDRNGHHVASLTSPAKIDRLIAWLR